MAAFDRFVGIPWLDRGRAEAGCDCWGLARLVLGAEGIVLPSHGDGYEDTDDRAAIAGLVEAGREDWIPIAEGAERALDLVLLRQRPWHVGIVTRRGSMLHVPEGGSSRIEPFTTGRWSRRLEGLYRHRSRVSA